MNIRLLLSNTKILSAAAVFMLLLSLTFIVLVISDQTSTRSKAMERELPEITVRAPSMIRGNGQNQQFSIIRKGKLDVPVTVLYSLKSTLDEDGVISEVKKIEIPSNQSEVTIPIDTSKGNEDLAVTIVENDQYQIGPQSSDIVTISENEERMSPETLRPVIVTLKDEDPDEFTKKEEILAKHSYKSVFKGFSARLNKGQIEKLRNNPQVASIEEDRLMTTQAQSVSTGAKRIELPSNTTINMGSGKEVDINVAVLDSGIDSSHPDLNVVGGKACISGNASYNDDNGHGTKVAGLIGAKDNDSGIIGGAPGAKLWSIKVTDSTGSGTWSNFICGLDFVTSNASTIKIANMSLAGSGTDGSCSSSSLHNAICKTVNAGVTIAVSSANYGVDASTYVPAAYDEVITVGAIVDTDGKPGGLGASTAYGPDDSLGSFSNYGSDVDLVAPGVSILSTTRGGGTGVISGTSASSPIVAGAAALYKYNNPSATPQQVRQALIDSGARQEATWGYKQIRNTDTSPLPWLGNFSPNDPLPTATPVPTLPPGTNLLQNSSFEINNGGTPASWSTGTWDNSVARTGSSSVRFDSGTGVYSWQKPPLQPSRTYTFQGWVKTTNISGGSGATMRYVNIPGTIEIATGVTGTKDWTLISKTFTTPSDWTSSSRFDLFVYYTSGTGPVWFDDVALCEGSCPADTSVTNTPAPTSNLVTPTPTNLVPTNTPTPTRTPTPTPVVSSDTTKPTISLTSPTNGSTIARRSTVTISATASDNVGVDRVTFSVGGNTSTVYTAPFTYSWSVPGKPNASYTISATAYDASNNASSTSVQVKSAQ